METANDLYDEYSLWLEKHGLHDQEAPVEDDSWIGHPDEWSGKHVLEPPPNWEEEYWEVNSVALVRRWIFGDKSSPCLELLEACKLVEPAITSLLDELGQRKAIDWGLVNDCLIAVSKAITRAEGGGRVKYSNEYAVQEV